MPFTADTSEIDNEIDRLIDALDDGNIRRIFHIYEQRYQRNRMLETYNLRQKEKDQRKFLFIADWIKPLAAATFAIVVTKLAGG